MKRLVTLVVVFSVCVGSTLLAKTDDQSNKKKKKNAQTTAAASSGTQTSNQSSGKQKKKQQATNTYSKKQNSNAAATRNYNQNTRNVERTKASKQKYVAKNNAYMTKKEWKHFKRTGNEWSYNVAKTRYVRVQHDRNWYRNSNYRLVRYGGGYWYWNSGWWYPAYGYDPYYSHYVYDGPIFGYGQAFPGDVTSEVQRALAQQGYYYGPIDGILGAGTRMAIQRYQISRGLAVTATIDEQTLATLGLT
jgi:hypothetical protein